MFAKLFDNRPGSGEYDEQYFDVVGETTSVHFEDEDYSEYCGVFGNGPREGASVAYLDSKAFIIASGQGYVFDINKRRVIHKTDWDWFTDVIAVDALDYFIVHDGVEIFLFDKKLVWSSGRITSDGIKFDALEGIFLYGRVYNFREWVPFTLDIKAQKYTCDWHCPLD